MVVAILAVLKAGGAYVPLDPALSGGAAGASCWPTPASPSLLAQETLRALLAACRTASS